MALMVGHSFFWYSISPGSHEISVREFEEMLMKKNLFFLLLHSSQTPISVIVSVCAWSGVVGIQ